MNIPTPFYIYDIEKFKSNFIRFSNAVKQYYPNFHIGYSYKTNYFTAFIDAVRDLGEYAEIVSPNEYRLAKSIGVCDDKIIYNGVIRDNENKLSVARHGGIVNIDNVEQLQWFVDWSNQHQETLNIGVRLNIDIGSGVSSRFGIDVLSNEFKHIVDKSNRPYLNIKSVHGHYSQARSLEMFRSRVNKLCMYADVLCADIVDIGGNMFGNMKSSFRNQFECYVPTFEEYAEVIGTEMRKHNPDCKKLLITEDGTPMVSDAVHLVSEIINIKKIHGKTYIDVDTKREDVGASCIVKNPAYLHIGKNENYIENAIVSGCTCVEIDNLIRDYSGYANVGDNIIFIGVGAYSYNTTNNFITDGCKHYVDISKLPHIKEDIDEIK